MTCLAPGPGPGTVRDCNTWAVWHQRVLGLEWTMSGCCSFQSKVKVELGAYAEAYFSLGSITHMNCVQGRNANGCIGHE